MSTLVVVRNDANNVATAQIVMMRKRIRLILGLNFACIVAPERKVRAAARWRMRPE